MRSDEAIHDLPAWRRDGQGSVTAFGSGEFQVDVTSPLTLWCPRPWDGDDGEIAFDCRLDTAGSAMLLILCARVWQGEGNLLNRPRSGEYADYAYRDLEMYTIGFNRAQHVSNDVQPNASSVNVRRIGGPKGIAYEKLDLSNRTAEMMKLWETWDASTRLGSALEPASGVGQYHHYRFAKSGRQIHIAVNDEPLLTVTDPHPEPLNGGHWAIRNMTPGASFRVRSVRARSL